MINTFSVILLIATIITGIAWFYDFKFKRPARLNLYKATLKSDPGMSKKERKKLLEPTGIIGQTGSLFFIILLVFAFRSFIIEPFRIPSGSMLPTLQPGDFVATTKWTYGIRNPLTNELWIEWGAPKRGDVFVFKYPEDPSVDYIKRVVGVPGDLVVYHNKNLYIIPHDAPEGSKPKLLDRISKGEIIESGVGYDQYFTLFEEDLLGVPHDMMIENAAPMMMEYFYQQENMPIGVWKVPEDSYFALGDNRDNSRDSRFWGFVPKANLVGKAVCVWFSIEFNRTKTDALPSWIPSAVYFDRIGGIR